MRNEKRSKTTTFVSVEGLVFAVPLRCDTPTHLRLGSHDALMLAGFPFMTANHDNRRVGPILINPKRPNRWSQFPATLWGDFPIQLRFRF